MGAQMEETPGMTLCVKIKLWTTATGGTLNGVKVLPAVSTQAIKYPDKNKMGECVTIGKRRKLKWYGHVSRSSGLTKTILQGTVKGNRRQGRQKKMRGEDNIRKRTGLDFAKSQRVMKKREK